MEEVYMEIDVKTKLYIDNVAREFNSTADSRLNEVSTIIKQLNDFIEGKSELSTKGIEERLDELIGYYTITLDLPVPEDLKILRAKKFEEGKDEKPCFSRVDELSYPPSKYVALGRCNKKSESIYYACLYSSESSGNHHVAFSEVNAIKGDRVNVLRSEFNGNVHLRYIGIWNHVFRDIQPNILSLNQWLYYKKVYKYMQNKFDTDLFVSYQICDAFFADILRCKGSKKLYKVTSILSAMFLESGKADGILYTSVKSEGSPVVALSTKAVNDKLKHISTESFEIKEDYGYSKFRAKNLYSGTIEGSGKINWVVEDA